MKVVIIDKDNVNHMYDTDNVLYVKATSKICEVFLDGLIFKMNLGFDEMMKQIKEQRELRIRKSKNATYGYTEE